MSESTRVVCKDGQVNVTVGAGKAIVAFDVIPGIEATFEVANCASTSATRASGGGGEGVSCGGAEERMSDAADAAAMLREADIEGFLAMQEGGGDYEGVVFDTAPITNPGAAFDSDIKRSLDEYSERVCQCTFDNSGWEDREVTVYIRDAKLVSCTDAAFEDIENNGQRSKVPVPRRGKKTIAFTVKVVD